MRVSAHLFIDRHGGITQFVPFDRVADYRAYVAGRSRLEGVHTFLRSRGLGVPEGRPGDPSDGETAHGLARLKGEFVERRLHERGMRWWDKQLAEYQALPAWKDFPGEWESALAAMGGGRDEYPFWLLTARSMQYA